MNISVIALCVWMSVASQSESFEKQAISLAQQASVSSMDAQLPDRPFAAWFSELVGRDAGVVWQLAECGATASVPGGAEQDLQACAEASVLLPNGNRMILAISVGTFKKGITGQPAFFRAVIESGEHLYPVRRLRDLPGMLRSPKNQSSALPDLQADLQQVSLRPEAANLSSPALELDSAPEPSKVEEKPPSPPPARMEPQKAAAEPKKVSTETQKISQGLLEGSVIKRRMPAYPLMARSMNAYGKVEVRILISEGGQVIEATAISGHPALRTAAVDAAREWVYKPTMFNGIPTKVETILTFTFAPGSQ
ncbi:MAG TPA: TonB family protein [Blastocatellia bacterium]|nr:TonB family protein [Blastocatellia bacterium]